MLSNSTTQSTALLATALRSVAEPGRLRLLRLCADRPTSVSELSLATGESEPNVSRQLKQLATAGLLQRVRRGQRVEYLPVAVPGFQSALLRLLLASFDDDEVPLREARARLRAMESAVLPSRLRRAESLAMPVSSRLGRSLRGALGAAWLRDIANRRVLVHTGYREIFEAAQGVAAEVVVWCRDASEARAWAGPARSVTDEQLLGERAFDAVVYAPSITQRTAHAPFALAGVFTTIARLLAPGGAGWLVADYDSLDETEAAPAHLRRLLATHGFDCLALIPVEADGEHVLAARARVNAARTHLPLSA